MGFGTGWSEDGWDEPSPVQTHLNPNEKEKEKRDMFVTEYMRDFSPVNAAIRCGHLRNVAEQVAERYMGEPYVLRLIQDKVEALDMNQDGGTVDTMKRRIIVGLQKQATYYGSDASHAARINALTTTAKLLGMEPDKKTTIKANVSGVMAVPGIATIEQWEIEATESQNQLVDVTQQEHDDES